MSSIRCDELVGIDLPIGPQGARQSVLAHLTRRQPNSLQLVLDDSGQDRIARQLIGADIPAIYAPIPMGTLEDFLAANEALTQSVVLAGGAQVGRLCVARAVQVMKSTGQDAASALSEAVQIGAACSSWTQRLLESAMDFSREQP